MVAQALITIGGLAGLLGLFWYVLTRYLDARFKTVDTCFGALGGLFEARFAEIDRRFTEIDRRFTDMDRRLDQIETRIVRIEDTFLKDYGERIARLEERTGIN
jgi:hypothetical protein